MGNRWIIIIPMIIGMVIGTLNSDIECNVIPVVDWITCSIPSLLLQFLYGVIGALIGLVFGIFLIIISKFLEKGQE